MEGRGQAVRELCQKLVSAIVDASGVDDSGPDRAGKEISLLATFLRTLSSPAFARQRRLAGAAASVNDEAAVSMEIERFLSGSAQGDKKEAEFRDMCSAFAHAGRNLSHRGALLSVLFSLAGLAQQDSDMSFALAKPRDAVGAVLQEDDSSEEDVARVEPFLAPPSANYLRDSNGLEEFSRFDKSLWGVSEGDLVRDLLFVCQGSSGKYVSVFPDHSGEEAVRVQVALPSGAAAMAARVAEVGWLYQRVQLASKSLRSSKGLVGQALASGLADELAKVSRLCAHLEQQASTGRLPTPGVDRQENSGAAPQLYLSLHRLRLYMERPLRIMRACMTAAESSVHDQRTGGALVNGLVKLSYTGCPLEKEVLESLAHAAVRPILEAARAFLLDGVLDTTTGDVFITEISQDKESVSYELAESQIPCYITPACAKHILDAGSAHVFLRSFSSEDPWENSDGSSIENKLRNEVNTAMASKNYIDLERVAETVSLWMGKRVLTVLREQHGLEKHLSALRRYMLLSQGDFIESLMDAVYEDLARPVSDISLFKLNSALDVAARASNAAMEPPEVLDCLKVTMLQPTSGDTGWDVFALAYEVRGLEDVSKSKSPLASVFPRRIMNKYAQLFNFLWRLRRVEYGLTAAWRTLKPTLMRRSDLYDKNFLRRRLNSIVRNMMQWIQTLQAYMLEEVIQKAIHDFEEEEKRASSVSSLLEKHDEFLSSIIRKTMLTREAIAIQDQLQGICSLALRLPTLVHRCRLHFDDVLRVEQERVAQSSVSWAEDVPSARSSGLEEIEAELNKDVVTIGSKFQQSLKRLIDLLRSTAAGADAQCDEDLDGLALRLDYNSFYVTAR